MNLFKFSRFLFPLFLLVLLSACSFSLAADVTPPPGAAQQAPVQTQAVQVSGPLYPLVAPNPENGKAIYVEKCAPCHGDTGKGDGPRAAQLPNPAAALGSPDVARNATPARWYTIVTQGNLERFMPPFSSLSDSQRWDVIAYAFSLSQPEGSADQGKELYQAQCVGCHGEQGKGDGKDAAGLTSQPTDLSDQARMSEKSGVSLFQVISDGSAPAMPAYKDKLSDQERWALVDYLRSFTFPAAGQQVAAATSAPAATGAAQPEVTPPAGEITGTQTTTATIGTVSGKVTNGSGTELPQDMKVALHGFDQMQQAITMTATLAPDGTFAFQNVEMPAGRAFLAAVEYNKATYGSDIVVAEPVSTTLHLPITVFDTTTDASVLRGDRLHLFFEFVDEKTLRVVELYVMSNTSNMTLMPEEGKPTVSFKLPQGAKNLEFQDGQLGGRYVETSDGFGDTAAVRPGDGSYQVLFAFDMPYDRKLDLEQPITLPVNDVVILVPEGSIKIKSDMLVDGGARDVQGTQYHTYTTGALKSGDLLKLNISGKPASGAAVTTGDKNSLLIGLGSFGAALILAGVWLFFRMRARNEDEEDEEDLPAAGGASQENAETVMDAILTLDDLYQAGKIPEEGYRQRRAELKARLKELTGQ
jgi:mono/diheme cytochrome c family protein